MPISLKNIFPLSNMIKRTFQTIVSLYEIKCILAVFV